MAYKFDQPIYENGKRVITQDGFESLVNNALADASFASAEAVAEAVEDQRAREGYVKATDLDHLISAKLQAPYEPGDGFSTFHFDLRQYAIGWLEAAPANRNMSQASLACVGDRFYFFGCYNGSAP
ncbi:MAG: hypothetical protein LBS19_13725, partial [Clostridiales bacterium]|nr:hypothetical protein [Clostridiales bacterium]